MSAWITLADYAQVNAGKLYITGGGIYLVGPGQFSMGVAVQLVLPWADRSRRKRLTISLFDGNGQPVSVPTQVGDTVLEIGAEFEVVPPPGTPSGSELPFAFAFHMAHISLPGTAYEWRLKVDDDENYSARSAFSVRANIPPTVL